MPLPSRRNIACRCPPVSAKTCLRFSEMSHNYHIVGLRACAVTAVQRAIRGN